MAFDSAHWLRWHPFPRVPGNGAPYRHRWAALIAVAFGLFIVVLNISIVGVVGPHLSTAIGASASQIQWAFDAYTVVLAGLVVLGGHLAERCGRKGFMQIGMFVFAVGSTFSAFSRTPTILLVGQAVSGFGAAILLPASLSITSTLFPESERSKAIGIYSSLGATGLACGSFAGGFLIDWFWWGAAFLIAVPVSLLSILAIAVVVPPSRVAKEGPLDLPGALLSTLGLGGIVFGCIEGPDRGWGNPIVVGTFALGLVSSLSFVLWELRSREPLLDVRVFRDSRVVAGAMTMVMVYFTLSSIQLLVPQYLGYVLNFSGIQTGLIMFPVGLSLALLSPHSAALVERFGQRRVMFITLLVISAGLWTLALVPLWGGWLNELVGNCIYGIGIGLSIAPATAAIMIALPKEKAGDGSAINMVSRQVGAALGVAVLGSVASVSYRNGLTLSQFPLNETERNAVERSLSGLLSIQHELEASVARDLDIMADAAMVRGVGIALALAALLTFAVAVVVWFLLRNPADRPPRCGHRHFLKRFNMPGP